jgi:hypothetical protein
MDTTTLLSVLLLITVIGSPLILVFGFSLGLVSRAFTKTSIDKYIDSEMKRADEVIVTKYAKLQAELQVEINKAQDQILKMSSLDTFDVSSETMN